VLVLVLVLVSALNASAGASPDNRGIRASSILRRLDLQALEPQKPEAFPVIAA
jgi:hypothetical protein